MAEKKKTTAKKATTPKKVAAKAVSTAKKKTVPAKSKTVKKKTVAKKTVKKVAPKKVAKKTAVTAKATKPKAPSVMEAIVPSVLTFEDWKKIAGGALTSFKSIWWRMAIINLASLILFAAAGIVAFLIVLLLGGGTLTSLGSEAANMISGTPKLIFMWGLGISMIVLMTLFFLIAFLVNTALILTYKKHHLGVTNNPFVTLFKDSWHFLGRYTWLAARVLVYVIWIPLLFGLGVGLLFTLSSIFGSMDSAEGMLLILSIVSLVLLIPLFVFIIWRSINVAFAYVSLIHGDKAASTTFHNSLALVKGNWWTVLWGLALFFVPISFIQNILAIDESAFVGDSAEFVLNTTDVALGGLGFALSFFVFAPLTIAFIYRLMLHLSERKNIKI